MPEGPEVSFIANEINKQFKNRKLLRVSWKSGRYIRHGLPAGYAAFRKTLPAKCIEVYKKGKVLFFIFENSHASGESKKQESWCMISKLGMTGWWYSTTNKPTWRDMSDNVSFDFGTASLVYGDVRNFGTIQFTNDPDIIAAEYNQLAPDILNGVTFKVFKERLKYLPSHMLSHRIEDVLIDQRALVSGIGNYLKSETLYEARLSPLRRIKNVSDDEWRIWLTCAKRATRRMLRTLQQYASLEEYEKAMKIYRKDFDPHGNKVKRHKTKAGRTTFWVPALQR